MRWMGIVIWREIVGKEGCKVEEVNEMDRDSDLERDSWKEDSKVEEGSLEKRVVRWRVNEMDGDSDLERDSWKRGL